MDCCLSFAQKHFSVAVLLTLMPVLLASSHSLSGRLFADWFHGLASLPVASCSCYLCLLLYSVSLCAVSHLSPICSFLLLLCSPPQTCFFAVPVQSQSFQKRQSSIQLDSSFPLFFLLILKKKGSTTSYFFSPIFFFFVLRFHSAAFLQFDFFQPKTVETLAAYAFHLRFPQFYHLAKVNRNLAKHDRNYLSHRRIKFASHNLWSFPGSFIVVLTRPAQPLPRETFHWHFQRKTANHS